ncbi:palmitoyltransferase ZDHHC1-like [Sycon ciliatum]|uniref:palmitoyltransferase ZDHHC1-like n=1 Tax=Sycon ciliatum TaxID=27933 RepID=UPI0031F6BFC8
MDNSPTVIENQENTDGGDADGGGGGHDNNGTPGTSHAPTVRLEVNGPDAGTETGNGGDGTDAGRAHWRTFYRTNGCNWPPHGAQVSLWILVPILSLLHFGILLGYLPSLGLRVAFYVVSATLFLPAIAFTIRATVLNPSDARVKQKQHNRSWSPLPEYDRARHGRVIQKGHCAICRSNVAHDSKHCGACNRCTERFDHHCVWLNNCVGIVNYRSFVMSITFGALSLLVQSAICIYIIVVYSTEGRLEFFEDGTTMFGCDVPPGAIFGVAVGVLVISLISIAFLGHLIVYNIITGVRSITYYDYMLDKSRDKERGIKQPCCACGKKSKIVPISNSTEARPEGRPEGMDKKRPTNLSVWSAQQPHAQRTEATAEPAPATSGKKPSRTSIIAWPEVENQRSHDTAAESGPAALQNTNTEDVSEPKENRDRLLLPSHSDSVSQLSLKTIEKPTPANNDSTPAAAENTVGNAPAAQDQQVHSEAVKAGATEGAQSTAASDLRPQVRSDSIVQHVSVEIGTPGEHQSNEIPAHLPGQAVPISPPLERAAGLQPAPLPHPLEISPSHTVVQPPVTKQIGQHPELPRSRDGDQNNSAATSGDIREPPSLPIAELEQSSSATAEGKLLDAKTTAPKKELEKIPETGAVGSTSQKPQNADGIKAEASASAAVAAAEGLASKPVVKLEKKLSKKPPSAGPRKPRRASRELPPLKGFGSKLSMGPVSSVPDIKVGERTTKLAKIEDGSDGAS